MAISRTSPFFILILASLMTLGPMGIDMYLPSLPAMIAHFGTDTATGQLTMSVFMLGFGGGQIVLGPLTDRLGRKPVMITGLVLFGLASLLCAFASSIEMLLVSRFLHGLAGASGPVISRAIVRDSFDGTKAASLFGYLAAIMAIVPMVAPILGGILHEAFGWQSIFLAMVGLAGLVLMVYGFGMAETLAPQKRITLRLSTIVANWRTLLGDAYFLGFIACTALLMGALMSFVTSASVVFQEVFGLGPKTFAYFFALMVSGFIIGSLTTGRLSKVIGPERLVTLGIMMVLIGALVQISFELLATPTLTSLMVGQVSVSLGFGLASPQLNAKAMQNYPHMAGTASSMIGSSQMAMAALAAFVTGALYDGSASALSLMTGAFGVSSVIVWAVWIRPSLRTE